MKIRDCCCKLNKHKITQAKENGKTFRIKNNSNKYIKICRVDGCLIKDSIKKCDFLIQIGSDKNVNEVLFLAEMKGTDQVHALRQIISSAEILNIKLLSGEKKSAIIGSSTPKTTSKYQNELLKLSKKFKNIGLNFPIKKNIELEILV